MVVGEVVREVVREVVASINGGWWVIETWLFLLMVVGSY